mmetsp:Transcript_22549/g.53283  ORF Transcript_22549/g.53283 Transcript_22549/m.53283 type:complete len:260 (+) Transcript_22549:473-1252(+)
MPFSSPLRPPAPRQLFPSLRENLHASSAPQRLLTCSMPALAQRKRLRGHSFAHCPLRAGPGPKPLHMLLLLSPPEQAVRSPPSEVILLVLVVADHVGGFQELAQREALEDLLVGCQRLHVLLKLLPSLLDQRRAQAAKELLGREFWEHGVVVILESLVQLRIEFRKFAEPLLQRPFLFVENYCHRVERVLADKTQETVLAADIIRFHQIDSHVVLALLQSLCPERLTLQRLFLGLLLVVALAHSAEVSKFTWALPDLNV